MFEHRTRMAETSSLVQRALHSQPRPIQHMRVPRKTTGVGTPLRYAVNWIHVLPGSFSIEL